MYIYQIMSNNFSFIDIILLAMIAGFIILRLRNILGRKTGHEGKVSPIFDEKKYNDFKSQVKNEPILKESRYCFLKNPENLTDKQANKLDDVLQYDLKSVRAYLLK